MKKIIISIVMLAVVKENFAQNGSSIFKTTPQNFIDFIKKDTVWGDSILIGKTKKGKSIYAYYFNKGGTERAFILAGVHGSEWGGVKVAENLIQELKKNEPPTSKYAILIIPKLFVDNYAEEIQKNELSKKNELLNYINTKSLGMQKNEKINKLLASICGKGRKTPEEKIDPNRQFTALNKLYKNENTAYFGIKVQIENKILMRVIQNFQPNRLASLHCVKEPNDIGIFADPQTNRDGKSKGYEKDHLLAMGIANFVKNEFDFDFRNFQSFPKKYEKTKYDKDTVIADSNKMQPRKLYYKEGNKIIEGISLGTWSSTTIVDKETNIEKKSATTLTIELPHYIKLKKEKQNELTLKFTEALLLKFLELEIQKSHKHGIANINL